MNPNNYEEAKQHMLTAFNFVAPNGRVQAAMAQRISDMELRDKYHDHVLAAIAHAITEGLEKGDWIGGVI